MTFCSRLVCVVWLASVPLAAWGQEAKGRHQAAESSADEENPAETQTLDGKTWDFKDVLAAYEPVKGRIESRGERGDLAVWTLKLTKDFEEGAQRFHENLRGSPFRIVLLDANRTVINPDLPATITPVPARAEDTIEMNVALPSAELLRDVKFIRVQRRTDVGF